MNSSGSFFFPAVYNSIMNKYFPNRNLFNEQLLRFRMWMGALLLRKEYEFNSALQEFNALDTEDFHI